MRREDEIRITRVSKTDGWLEMYSWTMNWRYPRQTHSHHAGAQHFIGRPKSPLLPLYLEKCPARQKEITEE
jgi:hypothetical protein